MKYVLFLIFAGLIALLLLTPVSPACPITTGVPASSYGTACAATTYATAAAPVYYAYPLAVLAVPTTTVQVQPAPAVPPAAPQPQAQVEAAPAPAALNVTVPQASVIVQRQVYASYGIAAAPVVLNSYAYGTGYGVANAVVINRQRGVFRGRAPVIVQRQRRFAPLRNLFARRGAARHNGGVPTATVIIRR